MARTRSRARPLTASITVEPYLGRVGIKLSGIKGADPELLLSFTRSLESVSHLYALKERIKNGWRLTDCRHPKKYLCRRKGGIFCLHCGSCVKASQSRQRAEQIKAVKRRLASAPVVRRTPKNWQIDPDDEP